jgi:2',5'-phosphodiesterase
LRSVSASALALEREAMVEIDRLNAESGGWVASSIGATGVHMRHPLRLSSACGDPEWTNFVGGFRGALDYVWCDTSNDTPFGAAIIPVAHAPMPPLEAVTRQTALPNDEFPSDHLPMVADVRFVKR